MKLPPVLSKPPVTFGPNVHAQNHSWSFPYGGYPDTSDALSVNPINLAHVTCTADNYGNGYFDLNLSRSNSIYVDNGKVQTLSLCLNYVIKC